MFSAAVTPTSVVLSSHVCLPQRAADTTHFASVVNTSAHKQTNLEYHVVATLH
jgi:hypothetical protein